MTGDLTAGEEFDDFAAPDACFAHPRLAAVYDLVDGARDDLDLYIAAATEFGAHSVLDVGCGTGSLATLLASLGHQVVGVDPAAASLAVARTKSHADKVTWVLGTVTDLPSALQVDLAVMTGNVAQVFVTDQQWAAILAGIHGALAPGGRLVFETRVPAVRAWEGWTREFTHRRHRLPGGGSVDYWIDVTAVAPPLVTFRSSYHFDDDELLVSDSTLRFRGEAEIRADLAAAGFEVDDVRDAPDRPGREMVFVARSV